MLLVDLLQLDTEWFRLLNGQWHQPWLDNIMPFWRHKLFWAPLYLLLLGIVVINFPRKAIWFILAVALTIGLADFGSSQLIKKSVQRLRPCNDPALQSEVHLLVRCGSGYSFTSSHATNHFALATFFALTFGRRWRWARWLFYLWAGSIAYGQVYVGVHYPLDIIGGALLGISIGWTVGLIYSYLGNRRIDYFYNLKG